METKKILKSINILYAEDNEKIRENTAKTLKIIFGEVFIAKDGAEAYEIYKNQTIHILLLDYVMPCIDGYELAKEIRKTNETIPIVICSGFSDKEKLYNAIELGVIRYIEKPLKYEELIEALENCLDVLKRENLLKIQITENLIYDFINKQIINNRKVLSLTKKEIKLFELFIKNRSKLITTEMIIDEVFENEPIEPNTPRNLVYKVRKVLGNEKIIVSVKDYGYMLVSTTNQ